MSDPWARKCPNCGKIVDTGLYETELVLDGQVGEDHDTMTFIEHCGCFHEGDATGKRAHFTLPVEPLRFDEALGVL